MLRLMLERARETTNKRVSSPGTLVNPKPCSEIEIAIVIANRKIAILPRNSIISYQPVPASTGHPQRHTKYLGWLINRTDERNQRGGKERHLDGTGSHVVFSSWEYYPNPLDKIISQIDSEPPHERKPHPTSAHNLRPPSTQSTRLQDRLSGPIYTDHPHRQSCISGCAARAPETSYPSDHLVSTKRRL